MFLFSWFGPLESLPDAPQTFDSQLFRRFTNHCMDPVASIPTRTGRGTKLWHVVAFVLQSRLHYLASGGVQHRQRLLASV
jgi:hypothetical protein